MPGVRARPSLAPAHQARAHSHRLRHGPVRQLRSSLSLLYITVCQLTKLSPILTASDMDQYVSSDLLFPYFKCVRIHVFLGHPDPLVRGMDPDPDPDPVII